MHAQFKNRRNSSTRARSHAERVGEEEVSHVATVENYSQLHVGLHCHRSVIELKTFRDSFTLVTEAMELLQKC